MSRLKQAVQSGRFVITVDIEPPKGVDIDRCLADAERLRGIATAINVADQQNAVMRVGSLAIGARLVERGLEPVCHIACRDRNRLALQSDLLSAWVLGVKNVLCVTGDPPELGDNRDAKPVYELDSVQLIHVASTLTGGHDMAGHELEGKPDFFLGAAVSPGAESVEQEIAKMERKVDAGAKFFLTQEIYRPDKFEEFMNKAQRFKIPVIASVVVLKSPAMARYINENIPGTSVPKYMIYELSETFGEERKRVAVDITARLIQQLRPLCQGVHIMPLGWDMLVPDIIQKAQPC